MSTRCELLEFAEVGKEKAEEWENPSGGESMTLVRQLLKRVKVLYLYFSILLLTPNNSLLSR